MTARNNARNATRFHRFATGFALGAIGSVVLGMLLIGVVSAITGFRAQLHGSGWLFVPLLFGFGGAYALKFADARRRARKPARVLPGRPASLDPGFAAAMREVHASDFPEARGTAREIAKRRATAA